MAKPWWPTNVTERTVGAQLEAARRYRDWLDEIAPQLPRGYVVLAREVADAAIRWYEGVLEFTAGPGSADEGVSAPQVAELRLRGRQGDEARGALVVENRHPEPASVSFLLSEFTPGDGSSPFRPALSIEPPRLTLEGESEQAVDVRVPLDPALFSAGKSYAATLMVRGLDEREVTLSVTVDRPGGANE